jgi:hypothetical protein
MSEAFDAPVFAQIAAGGETLTSSEKPTGRLRWFCTAFGVLRLQYEVSHSADGLCWRNVPEEREPPAPSIARSA